MSDKMVLVEIENNIATIIMNRPEVHNAFNEEVIAELTSIFLKLQDDNDIRAIILKGAGKSFSAGGDLNWMKRVAQYSYDENVEDAMGLGRLLNTIYNCKKPVIAIVHGNAFGGGVGLTAACDIALAVKGTRFCLSEVKIGLIPSVIGPYVIAAIGERHSRRYFMTAEIFDADEAARIGLVHESLEEAELELKLESIIKSIKAGAPKAQSMGKKLILDIAQKEINDDVIKLTSTRIAEARASDEGQEGLNAFLEKRKPEWAS